MAKPTSAGAVPSTGKRDLVGSIWEQWDQLGSPGALQMLLWAGDNVPLLLLLLPFTCIAVDVFLIIFWSLFGWRGINHIWIICCFRSFIVQHLFFSKARHCVIWPKPGGNHMLPCHFYVLPNLLQWSAFKARLSVWLAEWQKSCVDHLLDAWLVVKCQGVVILTCKFLKHVQ